ncbi:hypothetical protein CDD81_7153 [Ophiocordyceps australis]|uniref:Uncharacterized protein n=1 Tax=Ophiocordyceps australis TaxID=1399860 RepID=A0A2C5Y638_9HYPO|nr:hypothetical protein CDD81_7153 [Ophiocordyceps australis]
MRTALFKALVLAGVATCRVKVVPGSDYTKESCTRGIRTICDSIQFTRGQDVAAGIPETDRKCLTGYANAVRGVPRHQYEAERIVSKCRDAGLVLYCGELLGEDGNIGSGVIDGPHPLELEVLNERMAHKFALPNNGRQHRGFSESSSTCRDVLKYLAIAMGTGTTLTGAPVIGLSIRPSTKSCPRIASENSTLVPHPTGGWPACQYSFPGGASRVPAMLNWWARLILDKPNMANKIQHHGLDLESFKSCANLRNAFVSGRVSSVTAGQDGTSALVMAGRQEPPNRVNLDWCRDSGGYTQEADDADWSCIIPSLVDDLDAQGV